MNPAPRGADFRSARDFRGSCKIRAFARERRSAEIPVAYFLEVAERDAAIPAILAVFLRKLGNSATPSSVPPAMQKRVSACYRANARLQRIHRFRRLPTFWQPSTGREFVSAAYKWLGACIRSFRCELLLERRGDSSGPGRTGRRYRTNGVHLRQISRSTRGSSP